MTFSELTAGKYGLKTFSDLTAIGKYGLKTFQSSLTGKSGLKTFLELKAKKVWIMLTVHYSVHVHRRTSITIKGFKMTSTNKYLFYSRFLKALCAEELPIGDS
jgi:hypothetical protein